MFIENFQTLQMLFAVVTHLIEGPSLETLLTLNVEKSLTSLAGTRRTAIFIIEQAIFLENYNKK
jgi:hypothetical protein